jgi:DNA-binding response OmpR family regulator
MPDKKILIIDDDEVLCQGIAYILQYEGYSVKNTSRPDEAEDLINGQIFDIAIFDYKMPGITGIELLKRIKNKNSDTSIFIMSGRPFIEKLLEQEEVSHMVTGVLIKPFNDKVLLEKINPEGNKK